MSHNPRMPTDGSWMSACAYSQEEFLKTVDETGGENREFTRMEERSIGHVEFLQVDQREIQGFEGCWQSNGEERSPFRPIRSFTEFAENAGDPGTTEMQQVLHFALELLKTQVKMLELQKQSPKCQGGSPMSGQYKRSACPPIFSGV